MDGRWRLLSPDEKGFRVSSRLYWLLVIFCATTLVRSQGIAVARARHLQRGVNLAGWFSQSPNGYSSVHTGTYVDHADIALVERLGFDNARLSIDPVQLEQSPLDDAQRGHRT